MAGNKLGHYYHWDGNALHMEEQYKLYFVNEQNNPVKVQGTKKQIIKFLLDHEERNS